MAMVRRLLFVFALALVAASAALAAPPRLTVMSGTQFSIRGWTFHPGEHVVVVLTANGENASKRVTAGSRGGFVARFPGFQIPACAVFRVRATGDEGSHATLRVSPPECPQPPTP
jgi:hypothetical protein